MGVEEVMKLILEKLKEALVAVENVGGEVLSWFDKVFPPETRSGKIQHWLHIALPYAAAAVIFVLIFCFCRCCCRCCCRGSGRNRTMKAPGRPGVRIDRDWFEANPRGYFRDLRASTGHQLC